MTCNYLKNLEKRYIRKSTASLRLLPFIVLYVTNSMCVKRAIICMFQEKKCIKGVPHTSWGSCLKSFTLRYFLLAVRADIPCLLKCNTSLIPPLGTVFLLRSLHLTNWWFAKHTLVVVVVLLLNKSKFLYYTLCDLAIIVCLAVPCS